MDKNITKILNPNKITKSKSQSKEILLIKKINNIPNTKGNIRIKNPSELTLTKSQSQYHKEGKTNSISLKNIYRNIHNSFFLNNGNKFIHSKKLACKNLSIGIKHNKSTSINKSLYKPAINNINSINNLDIYKNVFTKKNKLSINTELTTSLNPNNTFLTENNYKSKYNFPYSNKQLLINNTLNNYKKDLPKKICCLDDSNKTFNNTIAEHKESYNSHCSNNISLNNSKYLDMNIINKIANNNDILITKTDASNCNNNDNISNDISSLNAFNELLITLENKINNKLSKTASNCKTKKYNIIENIFEEIINSIPLKNKKLLHKIITGYHQIFNEFLQENNALKEENKNKDKHISELTIKNKKLNENLKEKENNIIQLKKKVEELRKKIEEKGSNEIRSNSTNVSGITSKEKEESNLGHDNKYILSLNKKNIVNDSKDLDSLYFYDKVKMNSDPGSKSNNHISKNDMVPKLDFFLVDKISQEINKNCNINAIVGNNNANNNPNNKQIKKKKSVKNNLFNAYK